MRAPETVPRRFARSAERIRPSPSVMSWSRRDWESRIPPEELERLLFEWAYPSLASVRRREGRPYPALTEDGEIIRDW